MVATIVTTIIVTVSLSLTGSETFPWQVTGREVVVGQQPAPKGEITYSQINDENAAWSGTLSGIPLDSEWYCRLNITQGDYIGDVTIDWTLESSTDQGGTWIETGFSMTTQTTLSEVGQIVYASADGTITGNHNWGQHCKASAWYRLRVVINVPPVGLFKSGYETGDLTEWDGKHVWTGALSVGPFQPHDGIYSCRSETTGRWGRVMAFKRLPAGQQLVYVRIYVRFETLPKLNTNMYPIYIYNMEEYKQFVGVFARNMSGKIVWIMNYGNGGGWNYKNAAKGPSLGVWHCVEVMLRRGLGDGEVRLFVDGEEVLSATGLDNTMFGPDINVVLIGLGEGPGVVVIDCVEISTAYIGPE